MVSFTIHNGIYWFHIEFLWFGKVIWFHSPLDMVGMRHQDEMKGVVGSNAARWFVLTCKGRFYNGSSFSFGNGFLVDLCWIFCSMLDPCCLLFS